MMGNSIFFTKPSSLRDGGKGHSTTPVESVRVMARDLIFEGLLPARMAVV
jgi:hypothetical protein